MSNEEYSFNKTALIILTPKKRRTKTTTKIAECLPHSFFFLPKFHQVKQNVSESVGSRVARL